MKGMKNILVGCRAMEILRIVLQRKQYRSKQVQPVGGGRLTAKDLDERIKDEEAIVFSMICCPRALTFALDLFVNAFSLIFALKKLTNLSTNAEEQGDERERESASNHTTSFVTMDPWLTTIRYESLLIRNSLTAFPATRNQDQWTTTRDNTN